MREIKTVGDAITEEAIVTATCNNPRCKRSELSVQIDLWKQVRRFGDRLDLGRMRRMLRCQACGSGAIIAVLPKDWGNLQEIWSTGARPGGGDG